MILIKKQGFTLIELSIVLVIIGLLAGGILLGKDLIHEAQVRATVSQIGDFDTAINTFRLKYNCLPGDCAKAVDYGLGTPGGAGDNGNGNGWVEGSMFTPFHESYNFWHHLSQAGFITGSYPGDIGQLGAVAGTDYPITKLGHGGFWVQIPDGQCSQALCTGSVSITSLYNSYWLTETKLPTSGFGMTSRYYGALSTMDQFQIDVKLDNGYPMSGRVTLSGDDMNYAYTVLDQTSPEGAYNSGDTGDKCGDALVSPAVYVGVSRQQCVLQIKWP